MKYKVTKILKYSIVAISILLNIAFIFNASNIIKFRWETEKKAENDAAYVKHVNEKNKFLMALVKIKVGSYTNADVYSAASITKIIVLPAIDAPNRKNYFFVDGINIEYEFGSSDHEQLINISNM